MKYFIKIDRQSIKLNPDAGRQSYMMPGKMYKTENGWAREFQRIYTLTPAPTYIYKYKDTEVTCQNCCKNFSKDQLIDTSDYDYDENYIGDTDICPYCNESADCQFEFERIIDINKE